MNRVKLINTPDITWVFEDKSCIKLYALEDFIVRPNEIKYVTFGEFNIIFDEETVGVSYIDRKLSIHNLKLYYPDTNYLKLNNKTRVVIDNRGRDFVQIRKGDYISSIKLMSVQFFKLMRRHNNSDKGLASAKIKIEYEQNSD